MHKKAGLFIALPFIISQYLSIHSIKGFPVRQQFYLWQSCYRGTGLGPETLTAVSADDRTKLLVSFPESGFQVHLIRITAGNVFRLTSEGFCDFYILLGDKDGSQSTQGNIYNPQRLNPGRGLFTLKGQTSL